LCRFLQGLMGAPVLATGGASATDLYGFHKVPYALAAWSAGAFAGPALGPVMAAFAVTNSSWHWPMYELLIAAGSSFIILFVCLPETSADTILLKRARRLRRSTRNPALRSESEIKQGEMNLLRTLGLYLSTPFKVTLLDPSVAFINVYTALNYSIIVCTILFSSALPSGFLPTSLAM
jgi:DHA1 family multidrug resistance protein-like MFS transporter